MTPKTTLSVALAALTIFAGCGGGTDSSETTSAQTSSSRGANNQGAKQGSTSLNASFVNKASAICVAAKERASQEFEEYIASNVIPSSGPGMTDKAKDVVDSVLAPVYELQIKRIEEIEVPQDDRIEVNAILDAMREGVERAKQQPLQFIRHGTAFSQSSKLATEYGLSACATGGA
jgi:hypothetical protein